MIFSDSIRRVAIFQIIEESERSSTLESGLCSFQYRWSNQASNRLTSQSRHFIHASTGGKLKVGCRATRHQRARLLAARGAVNQCQPDCKSCVFNEFLSELCVNSPYKLTLQVSIITSKQTDLANATPVSEAAPVTTTHRLFALVPGDKVYMRMR